MSDAPRPPRAGEDLDAAALARWLVDTGISPAATAESLEILQYPAGHSNLSYRIHTPDLDLVIRRPPVGAQVKSGHDMSREYRLLSALHGAFPVPRPLGFDDHALGVPFYAMHEVQGVIVRKTLGHKAPPETYARLSELLVQTMADLHAQDVDALGLRELHRGDGYARRQVEGWARRWELAKTGEVPMMDRLLRELVGTVPLDAGAVLVHNDLKYDNLVLDSSLQRVVAVLDWEMATVGCPWMDLGTTLGYWVEATDPPMMKILAMGPTWEVGGLDREGVVSRYEAVTGRPVTSPVFYFVFGLFKIAVVGQQIYRRFVEGKTKDPRFAGLGHAVNALAELGASALDRGRISRLGA